MSTARGDRPRPPDRTPRKRAAPHGRSAEAEVRTTLESAVKPEGRVKVGTLMWEIGRRAGLTDEDVDALERTMAELRAEIRSEPVTFD